MMLCRRWRQRRTKGISDRTAEQIETLGALDGQLYGRKGGGRFEVDIAPILSEVENACDYAGKPQYPLESAAYNIFATASMTKVRQEAMAERFSITITLKRANSVTFLFY